MWKKPFRAGVFRSQSASRHRSLPRRDRQHRCDAEPRRTTLVASRHPQIAPNSCPAPLIRNESAVDSSLRRARGASRTKPHRAALRGSGRSAGVVDESVPGSANCWSDLCRARATSCNLVLLRKKRPQIAKSPLRRTLTRRWRPPRVAIAPSWLRRRLKAHRSATPFGEWSVGEPDESAGRLGAFPLWGSPWLEGGGIQGSPTTRSHVSGRHVVRVGNRRKQRLSARPCS